MLTKKISKKMGMISLILIAVITLLGIGVAVYATQHQKLQETVVASTEPAEEAKEVQEEVTPEEEEDYLKYLDEEEEKEEEKEPSVLPYYIKVNYQAQTVTVYGLDENGEYTKPVTAFVCSTGTDTPKSGVYPLKAKYRWVNLKGNVYGQYSSRIVGSILFHSVYYYEKFNPSTLCYTGYDRLGSKASAGCVRLTVGDAKWIYDNCPVGTKVEFYASSNPGPLGKPASKRISSNEVCRGWDPTDPDPKNPWHTYVEPEEQPEPVVTPQPIPESPSVPEQDIKPTPIKVTGVTLNTTNLSMKIGDAAQKLIATVTPVDAENKAVTWESSDESVATVDANGRVTAVGAGTTTITVTTVDGRYTATCIVTVIEKTEPVNPSKPVEPTQPSETK